MHRNDTQAAMGLARRTLLAVIVVAHFGVPIFAQGSRADYARAAALPELLRDKVLNETLNVSWLSDERLVYRRQLAPERWSYVSVIAPTGERTPAFDHAAVARQLADALGRPVDGDQLPIERCGLQEGRLLILIGPELHVFEVAPSDSMLTEVPLESAAAFRLPPTPLRESHDEGGETHVAFINRTAEPVQVIWLDRDGERQPYATVPPGQQHRQHTVVGHVWLVLGADDRELGVFQATDEPGIVLVDGVPQVLTPEEPPASRYVSPNGRWEVFTREHNIWLHDVSTAADEPLTTDGTAENEYTKRIRWSPDSRHLAVIRTEPEQQHLIYVIESSPADQVQPKLHSQQYLKPGDRIAHPRPCLFDIEPRRQIPIDDALFSNPWELTSLAWLPDSSAFTFVYNQRGHQLVRLIALDAATGAARVVIDEPSETFVDYAGKLYLHRLEKSNEAIWMSERDGWNHLYLYDVAIGRVKNAITTGPWVVRGVEYVDAERRQVWFRALGNFPDQDPYHTHYGRVNFDGSGLTWLTAGDGTHTLRFSPNRAYCVDTYSRADLPPVHELRRTADGALIAELERADWLALLATGWRAPERFVAKGRDGQTGIWGLIYYPSTFDETQHYPVIEHIYAGPHDFFVPKAFAAYDRVRQITELGFIVVRMDGMGTNWRSRAFHDVCWHNLGDAGFPDRIRWIQAAARTRPFMDLTRVGIYGGSAGGQSALRAMLVHGDFYRAAVADCGCHDNRMDKIWWNELWMGWPVGPHYAEQSNVTQAHRLTGDLLLVVGELDQNVDPASTTQVVDALIKADKDFEYVMIPGGGHGVCERNPYAGRKRQDFFVRKLLHVTPRWTDDPSPP